MRRGGSLGVGWARTEDLCRWLGGQYGHSARVGYGCGGCQARIWVLPDSGENIRMSETVKQPELDWGAVRARIQEAYRAMRGDIAGFRPRRSQRRMIAEIARAMEGPDPADRRLVIEAPTGVGKSFGYLLPMLPVSAALQKKLVVSTGTVALQEQLSNKDLPALLAAAGLECRAVSLKGRRRYACPRNLAALAGRDASQISMSFGGDDAQAGDWPRPPREGEPETVAALDTAFTNCEWAGDLDAWPAGLPASLIPLITASRSECQGWKCPEAAGCPVLDSRQAAANADVLVVNHDLLLADLALGGGVLLPEPEDALFVIDEAHGLEKAARNQFGVEVHLLHASGSLRSSAYQLERCGPALPGEPVLQEALGELRRAADRLERHLHEASRILESAFPNLLPGKSLRLTPESMPDPLRHYVNTGAEAAEAAIRNSEKLLRWTRKAGSDGSLGAQQGRFLLSVFGRLHETCLRQQSLWRGLDDQAEQGGDSGPPPARWTSLDRAGFTLASAPVRVGGLLRSLAWDRCGGVVLTSATLRVLGGFEHFLRECGMPLNTQAMALDSPFDLNGQAEILVPDDVVEAVDSQSHTDQVIAYLSAELPRSRGGTLVLFASRAQMEAVRDGLPGSIGSEVLMQGEQSRSGLLARHAERVGQGDRSVLFGLASFREGLDLAGDLCRNLVIAKLPFHPPDSPIEEAHSEWLAARGINPFMELTLPAAARRLVQGCGRLIRTETDTGRVAILDRRIVSKRYGRLLLDSLPPFRRRLPAA